MAVYKKYFLICVAAVTTVAAFFINFPNVCVPSEVRYPQNIAVSWLLLLLWMICTAFFGYKRSKAYLVFTLVNSAVALSAILIDADRIPDIFTKALWIFRLAYITPFFGLSFPETISESLAAVFAVIINFVIYSTLYIIEKTTASKPAPNNTKI